VTTRYNAHKVQQTRFGVHPLKTGYEINSTSDDLTIPSVGLEDVDRALFNLFDNDIPLFVTTQQGTKKVPIVLSSGEKWALLKKGVPRDKVGGLIIPAIVIGRTNISQASDDITGRGINQSTGVIEIKRRLNSTNRSYQNLINRTLIKNQANVVSELDDNVLSEQPTTEREIGDLSNNADVLDGGLLIDDKTKEIFETIVIPQPQFYTASYDVIIWCQYQQQMNSIVGELISSFLPQGNAWRIETQKGYWFIATIDGGTLSPQNNFDNMSSEERTIKYQFSINVPAYFLLSDQPGQPIPVRRFISNPSISFSISANDPEQSLDSGTTIDPFLGADDPTLPRELQKIKRADQRDLNDTLLYKTGEHDPALTTKSRKRSLSTYRTVLGVDSKGNPVKKRIKVQNVNSYTGETIYSSSFDLDGISVVSVNDE